MCGIIALFYTMVAWLYIRAGDGMAMTSPGALAGLAAFAVAQAGNWYHHLLLARLRSARAAGAQGKAAYTVPGGGLFEYVACPHYLCEISAWAAAAAVAPSLHTGLVTFWVASMLAGRSVSTSKWYRARFGGAYPKDRRHLVPFVF